jgi:ATP-dependent RNA helicase RhlE
MRDPVTVEVAPRNTPIELIDQVAYPVDRDRKRALLSHLVKSNDWRQVLVFCRTKHGANRLAEQLERDGLETAAIHGNKSQPQRMKALARFKNNELRVLVATDIAARGLDIESLPHVVNYDLPHVPEDYVHRIGRTGRAGESGQAVSLVSGEDRDLLKGIERLIGRKIEQQTVAGFEPGARNDNSPAKPQQQQRPQQQQQQRQRNGQQRGQQRGKERGDERRRPQSPMRDTPKPQHQGQRRDPGHRQEQRSEYVLPSEKNLEQLRKDQLEYARQQAAAERNAEGAAAGVPTEPSRRQEPQERKRDKQLPALFGVVGRKTG